MAIVPVGGTVTNPMSYGPQASSAARPASSPFAQLLDHVVGSANAQQLQADQAVQQFAVGATDEIHHVMLAVAQADLAFRLVLEIRNRLSEAYQEIMRMQV